MKGPGRSHVVGGCPGFPSVCACHCRCNFHPSGVFDVKAVRRALEARVKALEAEKQQVGLAGCDVPGGMCYK